MRFALRIPTGRIVAGAELEAVPVSTRVNSVAHDDVECLAPRAEQRGLF